MLWHTGPPWLGQGELSSNTADEETTEPPEECLSELKKDQQLVHGLLTIGTEFRLSKIINCKNFGSFERLIRTTSLVLKFCRILLDRVHDSSNSGDSFDARAEAEHIWILESQESLTSDVKFEQWTICSRTTKAFGGAEGGSRMQQFLIQPSIPYYFTETIPSLFW